MHRRLYGRRLDDEDVIYHKFPKTPIVVDLSQIDGGGKRFPGSSWLEEKLRNKQAVGWDLEWPPDRRDRDNPIALMQFADADTALLVRTHVSQSWLPDLIQSVLESESCIKICVGFDSADKHKMRTSFNLLPAGLLDLATLAAQKGLKEAGLKSLAERFNFRIRKEPRIARSNWAQETLTPEQVTYAAEDAYFTFLLREKLEELPDKKEEVQSLAVEGQLRLQEGWAEQGIEKRHDGLWCQLCHQGPMNTPDNVRTHLMGNNHAKKIRARLGMDQAVQEILTDEHEHNYIYVGDGLNGVDKGKFGCSLCGTKTLQNLQAVTVHINSKGHQKAMNPQADPRFIKEDPLERLWNLPDYILLDKGVDDKQELVCSLCQSRASKVSQMYLHIHGQRHVKKARQMSKEDIIFVQEKNQLEYTQTGEIVVRKNFEIPRGRVKPASVPTPLPEGWQSNIDPNSGKAYYWHVDNSAQPQWEHPGISSPKSARSTSSQSPSKYMRALPDDWEEHETDDGRRFYYCLRTLRVQWQRPTFASPFADGAQCRANIQLHEATSPKRSDRADGASTVPSATSSPSKPSKLSPSTNRSEPADLEPAQTEPAQPAPRDHSETRSEPAAQASTTPAKARPPLAPGWASYCDDNGREFFWDAEHQVSSWTPPEPYGYQNETWSRMSDSQGAFWKCRSREDCPGVSFYEFDSSWHRRKDSTDRIYWSNPARRIRFFEPEPTTPVPAG
eukprot:s4304_g2.t1